MAGTFLSLSHQYWKDPIVAESTDGVCVLYVDDDQEFLATASDALEREDDRITVRTAADPNAALGDLDDAVDCVVSDYELPGMDGFELFETIRESRPELPFILCTGDGSEAVAGEAVSKGVTDYLRKEAETDLYAALATRIHEAVEQAAARRERRRTRERFQTLLADTADYILVIDPEGTIRYITPSVERVLGYEPAELVGESALDKVHPDDRDETVEGLASLVDDPDSEARLEVRARHADGSWRWLEVKGRNLLDTPEIEGIVVNARDVTERKEHERAVDWHRAIIQSMEEGVYVLDADHTIKYVNHRVADLAAIGDDEWTDQPVSFLADRGVLSEGEVAAIGEGADRVLAGDVDEVRIDLEPAYPEESGVIELRLTPMSPDDDRYVLGTTRDVTDSHEREAQLRRATERYRTLIDNFPNGGVFTFDDDLRYTLAGGQELERVGTSAEEIEGATLFDVFPTDTAAQQEEYYRAALDGDHSTFEMQYRGEHYRVYTLPIGGDADDITEGMVVTQNVTDRRERKRELERKNERLDEFTSVVSHDLRNPLTVLQGSLEAAERTGDAEHFERCYRAVDRMERLVSDLRSLARQGEQVTDLEPVELPRVATRCWQTVETTNGRLRVETEKTIRADDTRLRQLLENLFHNAVEHGRDDSESVTGDDSADADGSTRAGDGGPDADDIVVTVDDCEGGFYVADDGTGIPPAERDEVFETGYSTADEGTGFGLTIVERIATAHGWTVDLAESEAGGARFEFTDVETPS